MKIVLLGSGNVASILGQALAEAKHDIVQVWSRKLNNAASLANRLAASFTDNFADLLEADVYIIAVSDEAIPAVISQLPPTNRLVVHTSGATPLEVFGDRFPSCGVFYPFQTFSRNRVISFQTIPVLLEAKNDRSMLLMEELANSLSDQVSHCNSQQRSAVHLAAAFACNFTNHLYHIADKLLQKEGLSFDIIRPLILETALKVMDHPPGEVQTGPAARNDQQTIDRHLSLLDGDKDLSDIYTRLTRRILENRSPAKAT